MSKRKMCPASQLTSKKKPSIGSSAERSEIQELLISKGTPRFEDGVLSMLFGINLAVGAISRAQEVLLDKIESIVQKVEILSKEVESMRVPLQVAETTLEEPSWLPSDLEIREWLNSPIPSPERLSFPDLTCYEMPFPSSPQWNGRTLPLPGSSVHPEWGNLELPTNYTQMLTSRSQEPSGGMDTCVKKKSS